MPGLPRGASDRGGEGRPGDVRQGQGLRGQPGPPRGQLRPASARVGEELRARRTRTQQAGSPRARRPTSPPWRRRLPLQREVGGHGRRRHPPHRARRRRTAASHRAQGAACRCWPARSSTPPAWTSRRCASSWPSRSRGQGRRRAVLGAPQGHDDEGLRPDHLRSRRADVLPGRLREVRRRAAGGGLLAQRRARRDPRRARQRPERHRDPGRVRRGAR